LILNLEHVNLIILITVNLITNISVSKTMMLFKKIKLISI